MNKQNKGKQGPGFGFVIGLLSLILIFGLVGELHPAEAKELLAGLPPKAVNDKYPYVVGTPLNVTAPGVLANDTDPENDPRTAIAASGATVLGGTFSLSTTGAFTYTQPSPTFEGGDFFYYKITDGTTLSDWAKVSLQPAFAQNVPPPRGDAVGTCLASDCTNYPDWNCTSSRTYVDRIEIEAVTDVCTPPICNPVTNYCLYDTGLYDFRVVVNPNSNSLYAMGVWFEIENVGTTLNPQGAIYGQNCYKSYFTPLTNGTPNTLSGFGPFRNLDGDSCGDALSTDGLTHLVVKDVPIV